MVFRAGQRVTMNAGGLSQFPQYAGIGGDLEGYDTVGLARVRFDGARRAIQLSDTFLETESVKSRGLSARAANAQRYAGLVARRKVLHAALMRVRKAPAQERLARMLVAALAGRTPITDDLLADARAVTDFGRAVLAQKK